MSEADQLSVHQCRRIRAFMNKWQIICPVVGLLLAGLVLGSIHMRGERRILVAAVTQQLDSHSAGIAALLTAMTTNDTSSVEAAVFLELQHGYATSLISRSDIHVARASDGSLECVIDTSRWGVSTRTIRK